MAEKLHRQLRQWSWWSRLLAATIGICVALLLSGYFNSATSEARTNMRSILDAISNESAAVTNEFLAGPETAAEVVAGMTQQLEQDPGLERLLFTNLIDATPAIDAVFVGFPDGTFRFVARHQADDAAFRTRSNDTPDRIMTQSLLDADLNVISSTPQPDDTYDPRTRSWYGPIANGATTNWNDPYLFSSSEKFGVTYSAAVRDDQGELVAVVGVDLALNDLVDFLTERKPSVNGSAHVVNEAGLVLAGSETDVAAMYATDEPTLPFVPHAAAIIQQAQQGATDATSKTSGQFIDGERWGNVRAVSGSGSWFLLVEAPETDFGAQQQGLLSDTSAKIALWSLLACALVFALLRTAGRRVLRLNNMATVDDLTGLLNRAGIFRELAGVLSYGTSSHGVLVAVLDLDRFKNVNDSYGHATGDQALTVAARRIATIATAYGMSCGRLGGDEFVIFGRLHDDRASKAMSSEIEEAIRTITEIDGTRIDLSTSIGLVALPNNTPLEVTSALNMADRALYSAKRYGGNQTVANEYDERGIVDVIEWPAPEGAAAR